MEGGGKEKTKEKGNGERRCSIGGLIETNEAQSFRVLQISFVHTWLRAYLPRRRLVLFFLFFISASTSGSGHERTKRQSEQSS